MKHDMLCASICICAALGLATGCDQDRDDLDDVGGESEAGVDSSSNAPASGNGNADDDDDDDVSDDDEDAGGDAVDNVSACRDFLVTLDCGGTDFGQFVPCDSYAGLSCDLVDYFDCLSDNFACNDGVFDASGWTGCASLATCA